MRFFLEMDTNKNVQEIIIFQKNVSQTVTELKNWEEYYAVGISTNNNEGREV